MSKVGIRWHKLTVLVFFCQMNQANQQQHRVEQLKEKHNNSKIKYKFERQINQIVKQNHRLTYQSSVSSDEGAASDARKTAWA